MLRHAPPAAPDERALVRLAAVRADRHVGKPAREHRKLAGDQLRQRGLQLFDLGGDVLADEEILEARVGARAVEVHQLGARDVKPARSQHVELDRDVREVLFLELRRRFHLDQVEAAAGALQDVDRGVHVSRGERRLVDCGDLPVEQFAGQGDPLGERVVRQVHELAARHVGPRQSAHPRALVEDRLLRRAGDQLGRIRLVHGPPQQLVALQPGREPGLGKPKRSTHWNRSLRTGKAPGLAMRSV